jgi:hypothetical protein
VEVLVLGLPPSLELGSLSELLQASEAAINLAVLLAIGVYSTVTLEARFERRAARQALYRLRSVVQPDQEREPGGADELAGGGLLI